MKVIKKETIDLKEGDVLSVSIQLVFLNGELKPFLNCWVSCAKEINENLATDLTDIRFHGNLFNKKNAPKT